MRWTLRVFAEEVITGVHMTGKAWRITAAMQQKPAKLDRCRESLRLTRAQTSSTSMQYAESVRLGPRPSGLRASSKPLTCFCFSFNRCFSSTNWRIRTSSHTVLLVSGVLFWQEEGDLVRRARPSLGDSSRVSKSDGRSEDTTMTSPAKSTRSAPRLNLSHAWFMSDLPCQ